MDVRETKRTREEIFLSEQVRVLQQKIIMLERDRDSWKQHATEAMRHIRKFRLAKEESRPES